MIKPEPAKPSLLRTIAPVLNVFSLIISLSVLAFVEFGHSHHSAPPPAALEQTGDLVDKAMALPGAIVLSPHRDLVEMGIVPQDSYPGAEVYVDGPAIAAKAGQTWCVWVLSSLAFHEILQGREYGPWAGILSGSLVMFGSSNGYQTGYDNFIHCTHNDNEIPYDFSLTTTANLTVDK